MPHIYTAMEYMYTKAWSITPCPSMALTKTGLGKAELDLTLRSDLCTAHMELKEDNSP